MRNLGQKLSGQCRSRFSKVPEGHIRGAHPPARLSEEICLSEVFLEASASVGVSSRVLRGSAGVHWIVRYACGPAELLEVFVEVWTENFLHFPLPRAS